MVLDQYLSTYTKDYLWPCNLSVPKKYASVVKKSSARPAAHPDDCACTLRPAEYLELLRQRYPNLDDIIKRAPPPVAVRKRRWPPGHTVKFWAINFLTDAERAPLYERPAELPDPCEHEVFEVFPGNSKPPPEIYRKIPRRLADNVLVAIDPMEGITEYSATVSKLGKNILDARPPPPALPPIKKKKPCPLFADEE